MNNQNQNPYVLNDPLSKGVRGAVQGLGNKLGNTLGKGLYKAFPRMTNTFNAISDWRNPLTKSIKNTVAQKMPSQTSQLMK